MDLEEGIKRINGTILVEIQGFFTERYINLCRINNVKIWNIQNMSGGIIRFNIAIKDFKKLKSITKKTKCKVKILDKKGVYFKLFKYRKRRIVILLLASFIFLCFLSNSFIWKIHVTGNEYIEEADIIESLKESGIYVGRNKIGLKTKKVINNLRVLQPDISWVGIDIEGTNVIVNIVEKTKLKENININGIGDIVSDKSGIIQKITVENGTAIPSVGDYIEEGRILIEGKIYSNTLDTKDVCAKGIVTIKSEYEFKKQYNFKVQEKEYTGKTKYSIGFTLNEKENYINYLDKSLSYDIIKKDSKLELFGNTISFDLYQFNLYNNIDKIISKEDILQIAQDESNTYIQNEILPNCKNGYVEYIDVVIEDENEEGMTVNVIYHIIEEIGCFKERI